MDKEYHQFQHHTMGHRDSTKTIPFIQYFVGSGRHWTKFYDFDLTQWGFKMKNNESWTNYLNRMKQHSAWETRNISSWDLSLDGARELNNPTSICRGLLFLYSNIYNKKKRVWSQS